jgi:outer membrane protein TolC
MSRDPAGAVISSAYQRIECFCRTRIFSVALFGLSASLLLLVGGTALSVESGMEGYIPSEANARSFTLDDAIQFAFQHNPDILRARQEIRRTKGVQIEVRAEALPHLDAAAFYKKTDPNLRGGNRSTTFSSTVPTTPTPAPGTTPGPSPTPVVTVTSVTLPDNSYDLTLTASQLLYNGSVIPAIRGANYSQDASIFALRDTLDRVIATVRQQFYQVILNRSLIGVQEESVHLLEQQLQDQQNRFEAGTVPRFNVLQAEVALANHGAKQLSHRATATRKNHRPRLRPGPAGASAVEMCG